MSEFAAMGALEKARAALAPASTPEAPAGPETSRTAPEAVSPEPGVPEERAPRPAPEDWFSYHDPSLGQKPCQVLVRHVDFERFKAFAFQRNIRSASEAFARLLDG